MCPKRAQSSHDQVLFFKSLLQSPHQLKEKALKRREGEEEGRRRRGSGGFGASGGPYSFQVVRWYAGPSHQTRCAQAPVSPRLNPLKGPHQPFITNPL